MAAEHSGIRLEYRHSLYLTQYAGLFLHPVQQEQTRAEAKLHDDAQVALQVYETDGASPNLKLLAILMEFHSERGILGSHLLCMCHQQSLAEAAVMATLGLNLVSCMYALALFLGMGGHFLRLLQAVEAQVKQVLVMIPDPCSSDQKLFANEAMHYSVSNYKRFEDIDRDDSTLSAGKRRVGPEGESGSDGDASTSTRRQRRIVAWQAAWQNLTRVLNGDWSKKGQLQHYCTSRRCCNNYDLDVCARKISCAITKVLLARRPTCPVANKWTKLGPALDFYVMHYACHNFLGIMSPAKSQLSQDRGR